MKRLIVAILAVALMCLWYTAWAADPIASYLFNEGSGDTVHDTSGFGAPLDLTAADPGNISWVTDGEALGALSINTPTILDSEGPGTKIIDACTATNEITIEVWAKPGNDTQGGPARLVTLSVDATNRNFTFGQDGDGYQIRLRTTGGTGLNGADIRINVVPGTIDAAALSTVSKLVYSRNTAGEAKFYVDGVEIASETIPGDFSNWDDSYQFAIGHELAKLGDRAWLGELHYVAIYDEALAPNELRPPTAVEASGKLAITWAKIKTHN